MRPTRPSCPICRKTITRQSWADDIGGATITVETLVECKPCGYLDHDSYGLYEVVVGGRRWGWRYDAPTEERERYAAEIEAATKEARKAERDKAKA